MSLDLGLTRAVSLRSALTPPISRIEDRSQIRRCGPSTQDVEGPIRRNDGQVQAGRFRGPRSFRNNWILEKYHDIYDISDFDITDALEGYSETEFEDMESLKSLKVAAARFTAPSKALPMRAVGTSGQRRRRPTICAGPPPWKAYAPSTRRRANRTAKGGPKRAGDVPERAAVQDAAVSGAREVAVAAEKTQLSVVRHTRPAGQDDAPARGVGQVS